MKRTGFKRKIGKPMKKGTLKKQSKMKISSLQRKIWELCKQIIRLKYPNKCYTCRRGGLNGSNWQTGHLFAKASLGAFLKYDLRVLRPQCYYCNINCGGRGADFIENMREIEGAEYVDDIIRDKQISVNAMEHYLKIYEEYKFLLKKLQNEQTRII